MYHSMVYDHNSNRVLLFGGQSFHSWKADLQDIWAYNVRSESWTKIGNHKKAGIFHSPCYDAESKLIIVLNTLGETWAYNSDEREWTQMQPEFAPSGRAGHKMIYDWESDRIILFGGFKGTSTDDPYLSDTWAYDTNEDYWEQLSPKNSPSPRIYHGMAYDMDTDLVAMWGGRPYTEVEDTAVWVYDYNSDTWTSHACKYGPKKRFSYHAMLYYPPWEKVILFGGVALNTFLKGDLSNQTWTLDLKTYTWEKIKQSSPPSPRAKHAMVYSRRQNKLIVFGGCVTKIYDDKYITDQLWIFDPKNALWLNLSR